MSLKHFLAGIHWNALGRILERVRNANGARSKRKWNANVMLGYF